LRRSLFLVIVVAGVAACTSAPTAPEARPVVAGPGGAAFSYLGAWSGGALGVQLAPSGAATALVRNTSAVSASIFGTGQSYEVRIDGNTASKAVIENCRCFKITALAKGLSPKPHVVTITNTSQSAVLILHAWFIDPHGRFWQRAVAAAPPATNLSAGQAVSFSVFQVATISIDTAPANVRFEVRIDDRPTGYPVTVTKDHPMVNGLARTMIAWGLPPGIEKITIQVAAGRLAIRHLLLSAAPGKHPIVLPDERASRSPLLAVFGDATADGRRTLGFAQDADGFADRIAAVKGWRLFVEAVPGASATCYGTDHVADVVAAHPSVVIVSFGADDMASGSGPACPSSPRTYGEAIAAILDGLRAGLPGVPIYVQAILPSNRTTAAARAAWNVESKAAAEAHGAVYVDPGSLLIPRIDYADLLNNRGHVKVARTWVTLLHSPP
jgi:hypothetical protein